MRTTAEIQKQLDRLKLTIKEERRAISLATSYDEFRKKVFMWGMTISEMDTLKWILNDNKPKTNGRKKRNRKTV